MSRRKKIKARDRITIKNTRDGLIERNAVTGEDKRISKREAGFDLRGDTLERETYSQLVLLKHFTAIYCNRKTANNQVIRRFYLCCYSPLSKTLVLNGVLKLVLGVLNLMRSKRLISVRRSSCRCR